ncbi:MAG: HutD family protein [Acetobacter sp.]|uniref:HutD/Ves family protein n=1 Tax=Acetobacter sp. TaxID=440 RepID=UPI0039E82F03
MSMIFAELDGFPLVPWRNGAGKTREIAASPAGKDGAAGSLWRISLASITRDCAFSFFPGFERSLALACDGTLTLNGLSTGPRILQDAGDIVHFSGDEAVFATCHAAPVQAFNLMAVPTLGATMHCHTRPTDLARDHMAFLLPLGGAWRLEGHETLLAPGMIAIGATGAQPLHATPQIDRPGCLVSVLLPTLS